MCGPDPLHLQRLSLNFIHLLCMCVCIMALFSGNFSLCAMYGIDLFVGTQNNMECYTRIWDGIQKHFMKHLLDIIHSIIWMSIVFYWNGRANGQLVQFGNTFPWREKWIKMLIMPEDIYRNLLATSCEICWSIRAETMLEQNKHSVK